MRRAPKSQLQSKNSDFPGDQSLWRRIKTLLTLPRFCPGIQAVCVPPGASLILQDIPADLQRRWYIGGEETVLFTQISAEFRAHRDAICFRNGRQVSLQHLREGLLVRVVSLGGDPACDREPAAGEPRAEV